MTSIKPLLECDFVALHDIHVSPIADVISTENKQFDLDDMPSPIKLKEPGEGKVSLTNDARLSTVWASNTGESAMNIHFVWHKKQVYNRCC